MHGIKEPKHGYSNYSNIQISVFGGSVNMREALNDLVFGSVLFQTKFIPRGFDLRLKVVALYVHLNGIKRVCVCGGCVCIYNIHTLLVSKTCKTFSIVTQMI